MISALRILAFGASLTEGYHSNGLQFHPYTIRLSQLLRSSYPTVTIDNAGVSGEAVLDPTMLARLKILLSSANNQPYHWILILAGTNDALRDQRRGAHIFHGLQLLIHECHQHHARVLCMTLPETAYSNNPVIDAERQAYNRLIREELGKPTDEMKKTVVLDVDRFLPYHSLSSAERKEIWDDGMHLTPKGYDRLGELIYEALQKHLSSSESK